MKRTSHRRRTLVLISLGVLVAYGLIAGGIFAIRSAQQPVPPPKTLPAPHQPTAALECTEKLPVKTLIGQKIMIAVYSESLDTQPPLIASYRLGGVILMDAASPSAITQLSKAYTIAPTIATDQEGGPVQRFTGEGKMPSAEEVASTLTPEQAYTLYSKDAAYLKELGITTNFAPVVDIQSVSPSPLPERMYGSSAATVEEYAKQAILAQQKAGITPVIKHFPGLGSASGNTDFEAATTAPFPTLKTRDVLPYQSLAALKPDVMVSNAIVPRLTNGKPAIWSPEAITLLRSYGYQDAVVYSDSLTAEAIPGSLADATIKAWQAGVDVAVIVQTKQQTPELSSILNGIASQADKALKDGSLDKKAFAQSVARILARKHINPCEIK